MAQVAASAVRIQTCCTIVDMKVEKNGVKQLEPSGWDEGSVLATLTGANAVLDASKAYVKFELTVAIKRVELEGFQPDGSVDPPTFFWIAKTLGASTFTPRASQARVRTEIPPRGAVGIVRPGPVLRVCVQAIQGGEPRGNEDRPGRGLWRASARP